MISLHGDILDPPSWGKKFWSWVARTGKKSYELWWDIILSIIGDGKYGAERNVRSLYTWCASAALAKEQLETLWTPTKPTPSKGGREECLLWWHLNEINGGREKMLLLYCRCDLQNLCGLLTNKPAAPLWYQILMGKEGSWNASERWTKPLKIEDVICLTLVATMVMKKFPKFGFSSTMSQFIF